MLVLPVLLFLSDTSESDSALWGKTICLCGGVHMSSVELCVLEMAEKARSFTKGDVTSATGIQPVFFLKEI